MENVILMQDHSHHADKKDVDRVIFKSKLGEICQNNPILAPLICYKMAKEELIGKISRRNIPMESYYYTFMYRCQKREVPLLPKNIKQFTALIEEATNHSRYALDKDGSIFYRGVWRSGSGNNVAFVSERTLQYVSGRAKPVTLLMDGTFRAVPRHLKFQQLYIINVIARDRCFPLAFILMERRDCKSYKRVFSELKTLLPSMKVEICMTDYERATRKAILEEFPGVQLTGCYFHYVQNIMKACKRFGMLKKVDSEKFKSAINKVAALALLPSDFIMEGFDSISKNVHNSKRWDRFCSYWLFQWKNSNISVYGLKHRTNNFSETLNRTINKLVGCKGPHIWKMILNLQSLEMLKSDELEQTKAGLLPNRPCKKVAEFNEKVIRVTERFEETEDVEDFLDEITFDDDLATIFDVDLTSFDDSEQGGMIPNHSNKLSEFRKSHLRSAAVSKKRSSSAIQANANKKQKK